MAPLIRDLKNFFISHILLFHCYEISNKLRFSRNKSNLSSIFLSKNTNFLEKSQNISP